MNYRKLSRWKQKSNELHLLSRWKQKSIELRTSLPKTQTEMKYNTISYISRSYISRENRNFFESKETTNVHPKPARDWHEDEAWAAVISFRDIMDEHAHQSQCCWCCNTRALSFIFFLLFHFLLHEESLWLLLHRLQSFLIICLRNRGPEQISHAAPCSSHYLLIHQLILSQLFVFLLQKRLNSFS